MSICTTSADSCATSLSVRSGGSLVCDLMLFTGDKCGGDGDPDLEDEAELDLDDPDLSVELDLSRSFTC